MIKLNLCFFGNLILIVFLAFSFFHFNSKEERFMEEINIIKSLLEDINHDIHDIEENLAK